MTHEITIAHELVLFPADTRALNGVTKELPAGTYTVEDIGGKVRWWKIAGEKWGNAAECLEAVRDFSKVVSPVQKVEQISQKLVLAMAAVFLGCLLVQSSWPIVPVPPKIHEPTTVVGAAIQQYATGRVQMIRPLPFPNSFYLSEYRAGWYTIIEVLAGQRPWTSLNHQLIVQIHRDLLIALLLVSMFIRIPLITRKALVILLPALILPITRSPCLNPEIDRSMAFLYPVLVGAVAALLWANPLQEETSTGRTVLRDYFVRMVAISYNIVIFLKIFGKTL